MKSMDGGPDTGKGLPRTFQRACLLMALRQGQSHGYELLDAVRRLGLRSAEAGGLYRCLRAMEEEGLVTSWWEPSQSGPPRRTYLLTEAGTLAARAAVDHLVEVRDMLAAMLDGSGDLLGCAGR